MKKLLPHELPCLTDSKILSEVVRGQIAWALYLMMKDDVGQNDAMPHEHLWKGGAGKSDEWLKARLNAVLNDIKKD